MPFTLEGPDGEQEFPDETLLIFIDETGHEGFCDPNAPFFGFGGCMCPAPTYRSWIEEPWNEVLRLFPDTMQPLHAADLRPKELTEGQLAAISNFFSNRHFQCFAAVASNQIMNENQEDIFHLMARVTFERIITLTPHIRGIEFKQIVMMFEHSQRTDSLMADYFRRYQFQKTDGTQVPVFYCTMTKQDELTAGLMVADFVAHTAGAQTRARLKGSSSLRKDFDDIFRTPGKTKASFFEVTRVENRG